MCRAARVGGDALVELRAKGVEFHKWPPEILAVFREKWNEVVREEAAKDEMFNTVWQSFTAFREKYAIWAELGYVR